MCGARPRYAVGVPIDPQNDPKLQQHRLERLRGFRVRPERDLSLGFLVKRFSRDVAGPFKQLEALIEPWRSLVPSALLEHTRLESLRRGTLCVAVGDHSKLYELDMLLRHGLQKELLDAFGKGRVLRIKLRVDANVAPPFDGTPSVM